MNLIVAREDNKDAENVKKFVQAYQSDEVYEAANKIFNGGAVKGWGISSMNKKQGVIESGACINDKTGVKPVLNDITVRKDYQPFTAPPLKILFAAS